MTQTIVSENDEVKVVVPANRAYRVTLEYHPLQPPTESLSENGLLDQWTPPRTDEE
jgi:hypothetical protein